MSAALEYLDPQRVVARRHGLAPRSRSRSGYGSKLPTGTMLRFDSRWHRVYAICWSNSATLYVLVKGKPLYLESGSLYLESEAFNG